MQCAPWRCLAEEQTHSGLVELQRGVRAGGGVECIRLHLHFKSCLWLCGSLPVPAHSDVHRSVHGVELQLCSHLFPGIIVLLHLFCK